MGTIVEASSSSRPAELGAATTLGESGTLTSAN